MKLIIVDEFNVTYMINCKENHTIKDIVAQAKIKGMKFVNKTKLFLGDKQLQEKQKISDCGIKGTNPIIRVK